MTPETHNGRFGGALDASRGTTLFKVMLWQLSKIPKLFTPKPRSRPLDIVHEPQQLHTEKDFICWLGHASFLIQLDGKRLLCDPVFGNIPFYKRHTPAPYRADELPGVDYVLISHAHYDHCDAATLKAVEHFNPTAVVPLNSADVVAKAAPTLTCKELGWYESYETGGLRITLVPSMHMSRRTPFDNNTRLWGGYIIESGTRCIYFGGDTGYGPHFKEIGKRFDIDYALLPISSYAPAFVMKYTHLNPEEAYQAFTELGAKTMIPMHYGTFDLSDEPMGEPLEWMEKIAAEHSGEIQFVTTGNVLFLKK